MSVTPVELDCCCETAVDDEEAGGLLAEGGLPGVETGLGGFEAVIESDIDCCFGGASSFTGVCEGREPFEEVVCCV